MKIKTNRMMTSVNHLREHGNTLPFHTAAVQASQSSKSTLTQIHNHQSKWFTYAIKTKTVIQKHTKILSTAGPKHDQINTALIAHHREVGTNWPQVCNFLYVNLRNLNQPLHDWAVLGEKITQSITCPVITVLHIEKERAA